MKIGVLGTGDVGRVLAAGTFAEVVAFAETLILAVGWIHVETVIRMAGPENFSGKLVMDATNPLRFEAEGQPPVLAVGHTDSAGESVQRWLPGAHVVKAFNIVGNPHMVDPDFPEGKPDMLICGNDEAVKHTAGRLIEELGWPPPIDLGGIENSRYLEPLAMVRITHFFNQGFNGNHAFKLLRK
jgi:predicted dinucleotide-binding enzyme